MNRKIKLEKGIVLNNNGYVLITKIRGDKFNYAGIGWSIEKDGVFIPCTKVIERIGTYIYGFYNYTYKNPEDLAKNLTPENMLFYCGATNTHLDQELIDLGVSYAGKVKWDDSMAPTIIYQGGYFLDNVSYVVSEHGELIEPANKVNHFSGVGIGDFSRFCTPLSTFLISQEAKDLNDFRKLMTVGLGIRYNPKTWNIIND